MSVKSIDEKLTILSKSIRIKENLLRKLRRNWYDEYSTLLLKK